LLAVISMFLVFAQARTGRIIGGTAVNLNVDPKINYQVGLSIRTSGGTVLCGGSLISPRHVLTAAHCVWNQASGQLSAQSVSVIPGISYSGGNRATASAIYVHPSYKAQTVQNYFYDVAILLLDRNYTLSSSLGLVDIATTATCGNCLNTGVGYYVSGYGYTQSTASGDSVQSDALLFVPQVKIDDVLCSTKMITNFGAASPNTICAGPAVGNSGQDSCGGDSGGPLVYDTVTGVPRYMQVGIVSVSTATGNPDCGGAGNYGVYTSVAPYSTYIQDVMAGRVAPTASGAVFIVPCILVLIFSLFL